MLNQNTYEGPVVMKIVLLTMMSLQIYALPNVIKLTRGDGTYPPFEYQVVKELVGIHIDIINEIKKRTKQEIKIYSVPWKRALKLVQENSMHGVMFADKTEEREKFLYFNDDAILSNTHIHLMGIKGKHNNYNGNINALNGQKIGRIEGFFIGSNFQNNDKINFIKANGYEQLLNLLKLNRINYAIAAKEEMSHYLNQKGDKSDIEFVGPPIHESTSYVATQRTNAGRDIGIFLGNQIKEIKSDGTYKKIIDSYLN